MTDTPNDDLSLESSERKNSEASAPSGQNGAGSGTSTNTDSGVNLRKAQILNGNGAEARVLNRWKENAADGDAA